MNCDLRCGFSVVIGDDVLAALLVQSEGGSDWWIGALFGEMHSVEEGASWLADGR